MAHPRRELLEWLLRTNEYNEKSYKKISTMKDLKLPKSELEDTLVYTIRDGKESGFTEEFTFKDGTFIANNNRYLPYQIEVLGNKRFEGMSNPADSMIYFKIVSHDGVKGYFTSSYGVGADEQAMKFLTQAEQ